MIENHVTSFIVLLYITRMYHQWEGFIYDNCVTSFRVPLMIMKKVLLMRRSH